MHRAARILMLAIFAGSLGGCVTELPYRWSDPARGITVSSDYTETVTAFVFEHELFAPMGVLQDLFGVTDLTGLRFFLHDKARWAVREDVAVTGWHASGEIHVMAGWDGFEVGYPSVDSKSTVLHEFVHALVERSGPHLPRWFEEGLCEVLSSSIVLDGELLWLPNFGRERDVRAGLAAGKLLDADELFSYRDEYPDERLKIRALYAQGTSFVWSLVADDPPRDRAAIDALVAREDLHERFDAWMAGLATTSVSRLMLPLLDDPRAEVRVAGLDGIDSLGEDLEMWAAITRLLSDSSMSVRQSARVDAICTPDTHDIARRHYREWVASGDDDLRRAGQLAEALLGDRESAVMFCRSLGEDADEWGQPLLWLVMKLPGGMKEHFSNFGKPGAVRPAASAIAAWIEARGDSLVWRGGGYRIE